MGKMKEIFMQYQPPMSEEQQLFNEYQPAPLDLGNLFEDLEDELAEMPTDKVVGKVVSAPESVADFQNDYLKQLAIKFAAAHSNKCWAWANSIGVVDNIDYALETYRAKERAAYNEFIKLFMSEYKALPAQILRDELEDINTLLYNLKKANNANK